MSLLNLNSKNKNHYATFNSLKEGEGLKKWECVQEHE